MKKVLSNLTVLFAAAVLIYSCNPIDEDQLPPNNTSQLTVAQAQQMIQGSWYCYKRQSTEGPTCAGGPNETRTVYTFDLQYAGYKVEFTNNSNGIDPNWDFQTYDMYCNGGGGTAVYSIGDADFGSMFTLDMGPNDLYLWFDVIYTEGYYYDSGGVIVSLTNDELVIRVAGGTLVYFKRSNQTSAPYNAIGLSGSYLLDNYKEVYSGIVEINEVVANGTTYTFTNDIFYDQLNKRVKYRCMGSGGSGGYSLELADADGNGYSYEVSSTHLYSELAAWGGGVWSSYKIMQSSNTELILRDAIDCNTYKEYHLTKVN
jgi:hypothetical protein